jgi:hypothetical protein
VHPSFSFQIGQVALIFCLQLDAPCNQDTPNHHCNSKITKKTAWQGIARSLITDILPIFFFLNYLKYSLFSHMSNSTVEESINLFDGDLVSSVPGLGLLMKN